MTYENNLDGWLPVDELGQYLAILFILGLVVCMVVGVIGCLKLLKRYLDKKLELENARYLHSIELEQKEDENWRKVPEALQHRIKELEAACKDGQRVIANLRLEILNKNQFLAAFKLKDLYDNGYWPTNKE